MFKEVLHVESVQKELENARKAFSAPHNRLVNSFFINFFYLRWKRSTIFCLLHHIYSQKQSSAWHTLSHLLFVSLSRTASAALISSQPKPPLCPSSSGSALILALLFLLLTARFLSFIFKHSLLCLFPNFPLTASLSFLLLHTQSFLTDTLFKKQPRRQPIEEKQTVKLPSPAQSLFSLSHFLSLFKPYLRGQISCGAGKRRRHCYMLSVSLRVF